jgi:hypothetical protein
MLVTKTGRWVMSTKTRRSKGESVVRGRERDQESDKDRSSVRTICIDPWLVESTGFPPACFSGVEEGITVLLIRRLGIEMWPM